MKEQPDRILRDAEVGGLTGLSRTTRWRLSRDGKFPKPLELSDGTVGWRESDLLEWIATRRPKSNPSRSPHEAEASLQK